MSADEAYLQLAVAFAELGTQLAEQPTLPDRFAALTRIALRVVPSAQDAAVTRGHDGRWETVGRTSDRALSVDLIQYRLGAGPCVDAVLENAVFRTGDLRAQSRWPEFGREAAERTGILSMLSVRLFLENTEQRAGLNLYSTRTDAFDGNDETVAVLLATHAGSVFSAAEARTRVEHLEKALATNREIGIAIGIIMSRHLLTADQAFDVLRIASQHRHRKLHDIAHDVIETGDLALPPG